MPLILAIVVLWLLLLTPWQAIVAGVILAPSLFYVGVKIVDRLEFGRWIP